MPDTVEDRESAPGNRLVRRISVRNRDDAVRIAPDQLRRETLVQVQTAQRAHRLPPMVETAGASAETPAGYPNRTVTSRRSTSRHRVPSGSRPPPANHGPCCRHHEPRRAPPTAGELGARRRQQPQGPVHVRSQSAAADEDQSVTQFGMLIAELHRHPAAEGLTDHGHPSDVQFVQEVAQPCGERAQRVVATRLRGITVARQVRCQDPVPPRQLRENRTPGRGTSRHPVDEQQCLTLTSPAQPGCDCVPVQCEVLEFGHTTTSRSGAAAASSVTIGEFRSISSSTAAWELDLSPRLI